ncbi:MAG: alpha/beta hydrolase [Acidimicrobiia bacterium]|nr:alpha/beta hydrolase [Acidimicrobiia bacterium]
MFWLVGVVVLLVGGLWLFQRQLIYLPSGKAPPIDEVLPGWAEETILTSDGLELQAWFSAPQPGRPVVVVFPGNAGNRSGRAPLGARLVSEGFGVLLVDYRGYGGNPGNPTETGLAKDARAATSFVRNRAPGHEVVLFGESLGAAVAIELATGEPVAGLILRSPFASLVDAASVHYPFLPVGLLLWDTFPSDERIGDVVAPVLVVLGTADSIVPPGQSRTIYDLAAQPKRLVEIEGADHNDFELLAGSALIAAVVEFLESLPTR